MRTTNFFLSMTAIALIAVACDSAPEAVEAREAVEVEEKDDAQTIAMAEAQKINWAGAKTFTDTRHYGTIDVTGGTFEVKDGKLVGGSFTIDMKTIYNEDLPEEGEYNKARLVGHLESEDFFLVSEHPTTKFEITKVEEDMNEELGVTHKISGNLTMRGETKNITIPAKVHVDGDKVQMKAPEFSIDRTRWNVKYGSTAISGLAKDAMINDKIILSFSVSSK